MKQRCNTLRAAPDHSASLVLKHPTRQPCNTALPSHMGLFDGTPLEQPVTCEHCKKAVDPSSDDPCTCPRTTEGTLSLAKNVHPRVRREKRRGKWCTVVTDLASTNEGGPTDLKAMLKDLRTSLGTGGGIADSDLVIQGDHRDAIVTKLKAMGYDAKPGGG